MNQTLAPYFLNPGETPKEKEFFQPLLFDSLSESPKLSNPNYIECVEEEALDLINNNNVFALDTETYSYIPLGALCFLTGGIRLVTVAFNNGKVIWWDSFKHSVEVPFWKNLKAKIAAGAYVVGHNIKFDMVFLQYHYNFVFRNVYDTMLASQVLWSGVGISKAKPGEDRSVRCRLSHSLGALSERLLGIKLDKTLQLSDFSAKFLTSEQIEYACKDAFITLQCWNKIAPLLKQAGLRYSALCEFKALPAFSLMEVTGVPVCTNTLDYTLEVYRKNLEELEAKLKDWLPVGCSYSSNAQLLGFFQSQLPYQIKSVDRESLLGIAKKTPKLKELVELLLAYRFLAGLLERIEMVKILTWRGSVRTAFRQIASAGTGRSSCTGKITASNRTVVFGTNTQTIPNLDSYWENKIPKPREIFKAPPGYKFIIYDLSQAHNRIACEMSQDPRLIQIYNNNEDAHTLLGYEIAKLDGWNISFEEFRDAVKRAKKGSSDPDDLRAKRKRDEGKVGNYSQLNQGGVKTVQSNMQANGIFATEEQVKNIQLSWRNLYRTLYTFIKDSVSRANQHNFNFGDIDKSLANENYGMIRGLTGRRQFLLKEFKNQVNYTDSISYMWISAEADMIKEAIGICYLKFLDTPEWGATIFNMVHDEINVVCLETFAMEVAKFVADTFEQVLKNWIKTIPVSENVPFTSYICSSLAEK